MNTDQFDGHTPGPWREILSQGHEDFQGWDELQEMGFNDEARDLIAAAPELLAALIKEREEAKSLRDLVDFAIAVIDSNHCYMGEEAQADLLKHLRGEKE